MASSWITVGYDQTLPLREWNVFAVPGSNTEVVISTLAKDTTYFFKVQARNSQGYGPTTDTLTYRTASGV